jgi:hypothetical protein
MRELLFEKYCRGALEPEEVRELKLELSTSAGAREALARHLLERSILVQVCGRKRRRRMPFRSTRSAGRLRIAAAAAAAILLGRAIGFPGMPGA